MSEQTNQQTRKRCGNCAYFNNGFCFNVDAWDYRDTVSESHSCPYAEVRAETKGGGASE